MTSSHTDNHDLDKLARWHRDLTVGAGGRFPVYAVFLVSEADRPAHEIFREFRARCEAWSAEFEHLVIFGQHGVSSTVRGLLNGFGLTLESVPVLVLFSSPLDYQAYALPLAASNSAGSTPMNTGPPASGVLQGPTEVEEASEPLGAAAAEPWRRTLTLIEAAQDKGEKQLDLASLSYFTRLQLDYGPVVELVALLLRH
jgi:hypothetical protein